MPRATARRRRRRGRRRERGRSGSAGRGGGLSFSRRGPSDIRQRVQGRSQRRQRRHVRGRPMQLPPSRASRFVKAGHSCGERGADGRASCVFGRARMARHGPLAVVHALSEPIARGSQIAFAKGCAFEHAYRRSFGRFALELLAVARGGLVRRRTKAALDEVRHARPLLRIGERLCRKNHCAGRLSLRWSRGRLRDPRGRRARTVREGCLGETIAACVAAEQAAAARNRSARALSAIAADERNTRSSPSKPSHGRCALAAGRARGSLQKQSSWPS